LEAAQAVMALAQADAAQQRRTQLRRGEREERKKRKRERRWQREEHKERKRKGGRRNPIEFE
jgi:Ni/Co efflux regulator RcnB